MEKVEEREKDNKHGKKNIMDNNEEKLRKENERKEEEKKGV